ncbi:hypothetical protein SAMN02910358_01507 [Lachnospiraceae bacterium XBB1006]|nr:hypothetical protein SAMN02910358_01507 [Lachnospiraceae bacterium XBB1006]
MNAVERLLAKPYNEVEEMHNVWQEESVIMKKRVQFAAVAMASVMIIGAVGVTETTAASKRAAACTAYKKFLKNNVSHFTVEEGDIETKNAEKRDKCSSFMLADLNGDGIPELVTEHVSGYRQGFLNVYVYKNGKVQYAKTKKNNKVKVDVSCNAAGWYNVYRCKKGHLHAEWEGGSVGKDYSAYNFKSGKMNRYLHGSWEELPGKYNFYKNGSHVTEEEFNRLYAKCKKAGSMHKNTAKNRTKYVK